MTTTPAKTFLIIDDSVEQYFKFPAQGTLPPTGLTSSIYYGGTGHVTGPGTNGTNARFVDIIFEGTSIAIIGNTSTEASGNVSVIIDGSDPARSVPFSTPSYGVWFQVTGMTDGPHNISISNVIDTSIDFAVIGVNTSTSLTAGQPIIVDDSDDAISYTGNWITNADDTSFNVISSLPGTAAFPFRRTLHTTTEVGDTLSFNFTGTSLVLYGVRSYNTNGILQVNVTLDENPIDPWHYEQNSDSLDTEFNQLNVGLYQTPANIASGQHTIVFEVVNVENLTFAVDYITYHPLAPSTSASPTGGSSRSRAGPIAGGVIGGVVFLLLLGLIMDCVRRRQRQKRSRATYLFGQGIGPNTIPLGSIPYPHAGDVKVQGN